MIIDIGGGIGSRSMLLVEQFGSGGRLRFVVQDCKGVVGMGIKVHSSHLLSFMGFIFESGS